MPITSKLTAQNTDNTFKNKGLSFASAAFAIVLGVATLGLVACSSGGDSTSAPPVVDASPTGYYTGSADVKDETGADQRLGDLQGMINGTRFMIMSAAGVPGVTGSIIYDGTITNINGNEFTADVAIYITAPDGDSISASTTTVTGVITEGSMITGTFEGTNAWNGSFSLVYAQNNSEASSIAKIETASNEYWSGEITDGSLLEITVESSGNVIDFSVPGGGVFGGCGISSATVLPIANTRLYNVTFKFVECSDLSVMDNSYTGLATTKGVDDILVIIFTDNNLAAAADYNLLTF